MMKKYAFLSVFLLVLHYGLFSQGVKINSQEYKQLKMQRKLPPDFFSKHLEKNNRSVSYKVSSNDDIQNKKEDLTDCNCLIPVDATFQVVPMTEPFGGTAPDYRCDDCSTTLINLPFTFCFYGQNFNGIYINKNGNVSFNNSILSFTAGAFPAGTDTVMIAPFWGDVEDTAPGSGLVYYKITPTHLIVKWDKVGYFFSHDDLLNTFQLIITDGNDPILPGGNNVSFCYGDMQWTTGDVSFGSGGQIPAGGFGGEAATVGANKGNNINYIQFGRFDAPGTAYDGPFGASDGVSWLDDKSFIFNTCITGTNNNIPPVSSSQQICDTLKMCVGDSLTFTSLFFSPEPGQTTTPSISAPGVAGFSIVNSVTGNAASITAELVASAANVGINTLNLVATDNGTPPQTTTIPIVVKILPVPDANFSISPPPPVCGITGNTITFNNTSTNATSYLWHFGDGTATSVQKNPTYIYKKPGTFSVWLKTISDNNCADSMKIDYCIVDPLVVPNIFTPNGDGHNDKLAFPNLTGYPETSLILFNRWGNKIYENSDYKNDWDAPGIPDGIYYFILDGPNLKSRQTGYVQLIR